MSTTVPAAPAVPAEPTAPTAGTTTAPETKPDAEHFVPQKEVDRILGERLGRERAKFEKEYADKAEALKKETREAVTAEFQSDLVEAKAEALAESLGFHDVKDALAAIDKKNLPLKDGKVDGDAVKKLLDDLVAAKPYLVKAKEEARTTRTTGKPKLPSGNSESQDGPKKMTAAEALRGLAAQRKHS
jgi:hypothetical protein